MNVLSAIATFYKQGGVFMHAVLTLAIVIAAIVAGIAARSERDLSGSNRK